MKDFAAVRKEKLRGEGPDIIDGDLKKRLDNLFFPRSIAIIGASDVPGKWGFLLLTNIMGGEFKGELYPVNAKKDEILGFTAYKRVQDIPAEVDLAIITIPAEFVAPAIEDCIEKGIRSIVLITSGFREVGEAGAELERQITTLARDAEITFIGPNTMGVVSTEADLVAMGSPNYPEKGDIGIISQSGNIGIQFMQWSAQRDIGVKFFAGSGNEAVLKTSDLLAYFGSRDDVKAVAMYIEGIANGREFMDVARVVTRKKPVIALKTGRSSTGSKAAQSHSGSMAGSFATYSAMFSQVGVMQARTPSELINVAGAMSNLPVPKSNRVGIMSFGGGWGVITADECEDAGLVIPKLSGSIVKKIDEILPPFWNKANPVDLVAEGDVEKVLTIMEYLVGWDEIDAVIALGVVGRLSLVESYVECQRKIDGTPFSSELKDLAMKIQIQNEHRTYSEMARMQKLSGKPVIGVTLGGGDPKTIVETDNGGVLNLASPEEAAGILLHMYGYRKYLDTL